MHIRAQVLIFKPLHSHTCAQAYHACTYAYTRKRMWHSYTFAHAYQACTHAYLYSHLRTEPHAHTHTRFGPGSCLQTVCRRPTSADRIRSSSGMPSTGALMEALRMGVLCTGALIMGARSTEALSPLNTVTPTTRCNNSCQDRCSPHPKPDPNPDPEPDPSLTYTQS